MDRTSVSGSSCEPPDRNRHCGEDQENDATTHIDLTTHSGSDDGGVVAGRPLIALDESRPQLTSA